MFGKTISIVIGLGAIISLTFGAYFFLENRYALAEKQELIERRLDQKIVSDQIFIIQQRMWKIKERIEDQERTPTRNEREELDQLKEQEERLKKRLDNLEKK